MNWNRWAGWALAALVVTAFGKAEAGIIASVVDVSSPLVNVFGPDTPEPNNDNTDALIFEGEGNPFLAFKSLTSRDPVDIVFEVVDSGGTTEYGIAELVFNGTGVTWADYQFELGFGTGSTFIRSGNDALDFDTPDKDPAPLGVLVGPGTPFGAVNHDDDAIRWSAGSVPDGSSIGWFFGVDVPDAQGIPEYAKQPEGGYRFTLRQGPYANTPPDDTHPSVPEPSSLWLLGLGGTGIVWWGRQLKQRSRK